MAAREAGKKEPRLTSDIEDGAKVKLLGAEKNGSACRPRGFLKKLDRLRSAGQCIRAEQRAEGVLIHNWQLTEQAGVTEVSADVDGFRLWFRLPSSYAVSRSGDPFVASALLPSMLKGETLEVDPSLPISPKLLSNIPVLQEIYHAWVPRLQIVPVDAATALAEPLNSGVLSFFSGGVDSTHTFLKHAQELTHNVFIHGFDFYGEGDGYELALKRNGAFVESFGKDPPPGRNQPPFLWLSLQPQQKSYPREHSGRRALCFLGFLGSTFPASQAYTQLAPLGSHPLTDPLWSNERVG